MCGRFGLFSSPAKIAEHWQLKPPLLPLHNTPRYNIAPGQKILAIRGKRQPVLLSWGLIPHWAKDKKIGFRLINARGETIWNKPAFRDSARARRCLIPTDTFYEWKKTDEGKKPYAIRMESGQLFAMAGLWDFWMDKNSGKVIESCTIITTTACTNLKEIHQRMPAIITPEHYDLWLGSPDSRLAILAKLLVTRNDLNFKTTPISRQINRPENDSPDLLKPVHSTPPDS